MQQDGKNLKILFCHFGIKDKYGFGRPFMLAKGLAELGHKVVFLTNQNGKLKFPYTIERRQNVEIVSFPDILPAKVLQLGYGSISILLKILFVTNKKFDIVHSDTGHRPSAGFPCRWNRFLYKSRYISEWYDLYGHGGQYDNKHWLFKLLFGRYEIKSEIRNRLNADGVVALSEETRRRAIRNKIDDNKIIVIHGGADIDNIKYDNISELGENDKSQIVFGYIGMSDAELDDLEPFIKAFVKCSTELNIVFKTFGKKLSQSNIKRFGLNKLIEAGWIDYFNNARVLNEVDVFILIKKDSAQNRAGWPNKLGDYLAAGRPILLNPYGDLCWFSQKHPKGFILTKWSESDIEEKINNICNGRYDLEQMGKYNREIAVNEYSWQSKSSKLEKFYRMVLN
jgi:glycosyltransferase involved in cell wall biosynthesis